MRKTYRIISVFLCVTLLCLSLFVPGVSAATQGRITGEGVYLRKEATTKADIITSFSKGTVVTINSKVTDGQEAVAGSGKVWYNVTYNGKTGYVYGKFLEEIAPAVYDSDFEKNLLSFPESYRQPLREIHNVYPNWVFVADNLSITLDNAINLEYSAEDVLKTRKWVELTYGDQWRDIRATDLGENGKHLMENRWTFASREAIGFFMDPRNALVVSNKKSSFPNIFTFLQQSYDENTQNEAGLRTTVKGTFLENGYDGDKDAYIKDIMEAAKQSGVSPYVIAATIIIEQGVKGTSSLISGTYPGYEGYYNFFNYNASGNDIIGNGLSYAKEQVWNSRAASILGGAKKYESGYLSMGQDTYYYMDFNIKNPQKIYHEYAQNLYDQCIKAVKLRDTCITNSNATYTFKIPVYSSMPATPYKELTMEDYKPSGDTPSGDTPSGDTPSGDTPEPEPPEPTVPSRKKGDVSGDGQITVKDFAEIRMHLLGVKTLTGKDLYAADVNSDNSVTVKDFAMVRMYLLGLISL